jgi:hypothetical protein
MAASVFDNLEPEAVSKYQRLKDGDILVLESIKEQKTEEFVYAKPDGTVDKTMKKVYKMLDGSEWQVPITVHNSIIVLRKEYGAKLVAVKVKREGAGKQTKYTALPQLAKE